MGFFAKNFIKYTQFQEHNQPSYLHSSNPDTSFHSANIRVRCVFPLFLVQVTEIFRKTVQIAVKVVKLETDTITKSLEVTATVQHAERIHQTFYFPENFSLPKEYHMVTESFIAH